MTSSSTLAELLVREADLYDELLTLLHDEERALIAGDTRSVGDCLARTETLVLKLRLLETSRETLVAQLAGDRRTRLADLPGADHGALATARARLEATLPTVERVNRRVTALLERSLRLFDVTLELIRGAAGLGRQYTAAGTLAPAGRAMIDGRA
jgi:flagellar biosynthesis/type III secretory pathway chaperone